MQSKIKGRDIRPKDKDFCIRCGTLLSFGVCPGINCPTNTK